MGIGSEHHLFRLLPESLASKIELTVYNRRQRKLFADKGYLSADYQLDLFTSSNINLEVPMRNNQRDFKQYPYIFKKCRKRIETLFSRLCDQFMIRINYAKSFDGFKNRIASKITALTIIQLINMYEKRNINNLKVIIC